MRAPRSAWDRCRATSPWKTNVSWKSAVAGRAVDQLHVLRREPGAELVDKLAVGAHAPGVAQHHLARGLAVAVGNHHLAGSLPRRPVGLEHLLQPLRVG